MNMRRQQTFVSKEESEGEEFDGAPGDPPEDGGQRRLPLRDRADRHRDAEAHDPHEPEIRINKNTQNHVVARET